MDNARTLSARSRAPLTEDGVKWWDIIGNKPENILYSDDTYEHSAVRIPKSKSQPDFTSSSVISTENVLKPSDLRRQIKLAKLRAIGSIFDDLARNSLARSKSLTDDNLHRSSSRHNEDFSPYSQPARSCHCFRSHYKADDIKKHIERKPCSIVRQNAVENIDRRDPQKTVQIKVDYASNSESLVDEEHTIKPSLVKIQTKIARILGKDRDEELLSKLNRCRLSSDTPSIACQNTIRDSHGSIRESYNPSISWAKNFQDTERWRGSTTAGFEEQVKMPRLPSSRKETLSAPRSARAPSSNAPSSLRRPLPLTGSATLPRRTKFLEKPPPSLSPSSMDSQGSGSELRRQNDELKTRLAVESADHRRRLEAYKRAQQGQAALVSRLQAKVLQYKQRCSELESQVHHTPRPESFISTTTKPHSKAIALPSSHVSLPAACIPYNVELHKKEERIDDLETSLRRLEEERRKCEKHLEQNKVLREQLEESQQINEALTNDLQKLTNDWEALREEIIIKEDEWKDEEQAFNDYYTTEHNRLLNLWREVAGVKRHFSELQSLTERELIKFKGDVDSSVRDLLETYSKFNMNALCNGSGIKSEQQYPDAKLEQQGESINAKQLHSELREMITQKDKALIDLRERDGRIQKLIAEMQTLEERCESLEKCSEEATLLRSALEEVARALIADSGSQPLHPGSPKRVRPHTPNSTGFAESTISAVHAALHKYQLHIHELQVKLQNAKDQLSSCKKHCESVDANNNNLEQKVHNLQGQLDEANTEINQLQQEKESLQKTTEMLRSEKYSLDRNRMDVNAMVESLTSDFEKLQKVNTKMERAIETLEAEKRDLLIDIERLQREVSNREIGLRSEEENNSRLRTEILTIREDLNSSQLSNQLLHQQKAEADAIILQLEKHRADLEIEMEHVVAERADLQDAVEKLQNNIEILQQDRKRLFELTKQLEEEKSSLSNQSSDHASDMNAMKKELLTAEEIRLELENDRASLLEKIKQLECEKEKIETDLSQSILERSELGSQLTAIGRKKDALNEEIIRMQQRLEQCNETNGRLNRSLEEYIKETEEKQIHIDTIEKEKQHLQEQLCSILTEKDALESALFDTNNMLEGSEVKSKQLDAQLQSCLIAQEKLKGQISRLNKELETNEKRLREQKSSSNQQSSKKEAEYQHIISNLNRTATESIGKLNEEKEHLRKTLEQKLSNTIATLTAEKEALEVNLREKERKWRSAKEALITQHDEAMLRAENEKQQALLIVQHDLQALNERLEEAKRLLDNEQNNVERLKRELQSRSDQDRATINQLKEELASLKMRLDEVKAIAEDDNIRNENKMKELQSEKESCQREIQELKGQLQLSEEKCDDISAQLNETLRKLKEVENEAESVRKELLESRRELQTRGVERDQLSATCVRLREHVTRAEAEKRDANRSAQEAYHKIAGLEEARTSLESERSRLQTLLKESETTFERIQRESQSLEEQLKREKSGNEQNQNETKELQARLANESEERSRISAEAGAARRRAAELEALLHAARTDLGRHHRRAAELDQALKARDQELILRLEDCRSKERRLEELKHNLEVCLADATQQIQELKARLGGCESRCRGVEAQLASCEAERRDAQLRLSSLVRSLRRVAGIQPDGSLQPPARLTSPARRYSPRRGRDHSEERGELIDVDPELIKKGIRTLMHEVNQVEREKEEYKSQICVMRKQLKEITEQQGKGEGKVTHLTQNLRTAQEHAAKLQNQLHQRDSQVKAQNETIQSKTMEINTLRDRIHTLETSIASLSEEKGQTEVNAEKIRQLMAERDAELNEARAAATEAEGRTSRLQLRLTHVTADLQRQTQRVSDLEGACVKLKEQCEAHVRTITSLEERCSSLKTSIEQLSCSLQKGASSEGELRAEVARLQRHYNDSKNNEQNALEKLRLCQKSLSAIENEKRVLVEKLDSAKLQCAELKRTNASLEDQVHRLNSQLANLEVQRSGLESRLRFTTAFDAKESCDSDAERELRALQREKDDYKADVDRMKDTIRKLESEMHHQKSSFRSRSHERLDKCLYGGDYEASAADLQLIRRKAGGGISPEFALLEVENRELRMKIRRLEKELSDRDCEISQLRSKMINESGGTVDRDSYKLLEVREASHRQQVRALESQISQLRAQLASEVRRRQNYVSRSGRASRDVQRLRTALGDSLRTVSQEPSLDSYLLEQEARKLDNTLTYSLPAFNDSYDSSK